MLLGISRSTLYRSVQRGDFPAAIVRINGRIRVPRRAIERLISGTAADSTTVGAESAGLKASIYCPTCGSAPRTMSSPERRTPICSAARRSSSSTPSV